MFSSVFCSVFCSVLYASMSCGCVLCKCLFVLCVSQLREKVHAEKNMHGWLKGQLDQQIMEGIQSE